MICIRLLVETRIPHAGRTQPHAHAPCRNVFVEPRRALWNYSSIMGAIQSHVVVNIREQSMHVDHASDSSLPRMAVHLPIDLKRTGAVIKIRQKCLKSLIRGEDW